jgi:hypothetical protein
MISDDERGEERNIMEGLRLVFIQSQHPHDSIVKAVCLNVGVSTIDCPPSGPSASKPLNSPPNIS